MTAPRPSVGPTPAELRASAFVGRKAELDALRRQLEQALGGHGSLAFLAGEPGIGKTRLAMEVGRAASARGVSVVFGGCDPAALGLPYLPLRRARAEFDPGANSVPVAAVLRQLAQTTRDDQAGGELRVPEDEVYARRERLATLIGELASERPLLLILDDLQWGDHETIGLLPLLGAASQDARLLVLGTFRDGEVVGEHPLNSALGDLNRRRQAVRLQLMALEEHEGEALARAVGDVGGLSRGIAVRAGGNPFYIEEIVRDLLQRAGVAGSDAGLPVDGVPHGVRDVIAQRIARVSGSCRSALDAAAVLGRQIDSSPLARLLGFDALQASAALDEAVGAGFLVVSRDGTSEYQFRHDLVRDILYQGLAPSQRRQLHRSAADAFAALPGDHADLGHHLVSAGELASPRELAEHFARAGEDAMALSAYDTATSHLRRAAECVPAADAPFSASIQRLLGRALVGSGDLERGVQAYERALTLMPGDESADLRADVRLEIVTSLGRFSKYRLALPYVERALDDVRDEASMTVLALRTELSRCLTWTGDRARARELIDAVIPQTDAAGSPLLRARARMVRADWCSATGDIRTAAELHSAAAQLALDAGDLRLAAINLHMAGVFLMQAGRPGDAMTLSHRAVELAEQCRDLPTIAEARSIRALAQLVRGNWDAASAEIERGRVAAARLRQLPALTLYLTSVDWQMRLWRAGTDELEELRVAIATGPSLGRPAYEGMRAIFLAKVLCAQGRTAAARDTIAPLARMVARQAPTAGRDAWIVGASLIASTYADAGDSEAAQEWYESLRPFADQYAPHTIPALELGRIAALSDRWDDAFAWFNTARELAERVESKPFGALAAFEAGIAYARRGEEGDTLRAQSAFEAASILFATLGMVRYQADAQHRLEVALGTYRAGGLTPRETEIVRLIALGCTNRTIAERLVLSENTVIRHVANIFNKLGVDNRAAATAWAAQAGLAPIRPG